MKNINTQACTLKQQMRSVTRDLAGLSRLYAPAAPGFSYPDIRPHLWRHRLGSFFPFFQTKEIMLQFFDFRPWGASSPLGGAFYQSRDTSVHLLLSNSAIRVKGYESLDRQGVGTRGKTVSRWWERFQLRPIAASSLLWRRRDIFGQMVK